jgi:quercetin dioxygenase-like cupin family protein
MSSYTKVHWDALPDSKVPPPEGYEHPWPTFAPYTSRVVSGSVDCEFLAMSMSCAQPGQSGQHHRHETAEEVFVIMQGSCRMRIDDEVVELRQFDTIRVPADAYRSIHNHTGARDDRDPRRRHADVRRRRLGDHRPRPGARRASTPPSSWPAPAPCSPGTAPTGSATSSSATGWTG